MIHPDPISRMWRNGPPPGFRIDSNVAAVIVLGARVDCHQEYDGATAAISGSNAAIGWPAHDKMSAAAAGSVHYASFDIHYNVVGTAGREFEQEARLLFNKWLLISTPPWFDMVFKRTFHYGRGQRRPGAIQRYGDGHQFRDATYRAGNGKYNQPDRQHASGQQQRQPAMAGQGGRRLPRSSRSIRDQTHVRYNVETKGWYIYGASYAPRYHGKWACAALEMRRYISRVGYVANLRQTKHLGEALTNIGGTQRRRRAKHRGLPSATVT